MKRLWYFFTYLNRYTDHERTLFGTWEGKCPSRSKLWKQLERHAQTNNIFGYGYQDTPIHPENSQTI